MPPVAVISITHGDSRVTPPSAVPKGRGRLSAPWKPNTCCRQDHSRA